jgi:hypothetical protein
MIMHQWWNDERHGNTKKSRKNMLQRHFVRHEFNPEEIREQTRVSVVRSQRLIALSQY